ncbi:MAG: hypothetical protein KKH41_04750 [Candidatus Thermoplasmatota archaeon]|nr:hypothetical protein [Euryarchaeota archaeon]MBU4071872.1 hypothetical protein [Candidatus Thermoplasmatota archaeon]MBU4144009.1 hypothetical protein [Candidatus Thermoplasmatota archaeon]MBU4591877.1 hypothetical protein [Candidatus Thermoplasmatota archaeon]
MPEILQKLNCPDCGGPLKVQAGDAIVTCGYCGSDVNLAVGSKYFLKHSIIPPRIGQDSIDSVIKAWMGRGFLKPDDLARKYKLVSRELQMLPLFIVNATVRTEYEGEITRTGQPAPRSGVLEKEYYWKVLGRRASAFPTREYQVPLAAKEDFEISKLVPGIKFLNSEMAEDEAINIARQEMEAHHRFLLEKELDTLSRFETKFDIRNTEFLHVSAWFITYQYNGKLYNLILDGATGDDVKADIPQKGKGLFGGLLGG